MTQQIKPAYATFEQAKWLKDKEWQQRTKMVWLDSLGKQHLREVHLSLELNNAEYDAPEHWQVVEWLRINHGIWVCVNKSKDAEDNGWFHYYVDNKWSAKLYDTPQEAYSAAFDYIKDNDLI
jgi:hypothetical protein